MEVGDIRFERCVMEIPDRILFNSKSATAQKLICRCTPLRRGMLEIRARAIIASRQDIDRF